MHGQVIRKTTEKVDKEETRQWLSRGDLKVRTEALLCAAQEQAIRTNYIKYHIDKTSERPLCRLCDILTEERRLDLIVIDKKEQKVIVIGIAVPADVRVEEKEKEKKEKYQDLKREIRRLWKLRNLKIVPVVIGTLGSVSAEYRWTGKLGITCNVGVMQKTALLGTAKILRKVLEI